jgi:bla regulator protein blaR1
MILRALSVLWTSYAPQMANHLWQSTLFVVLAAMLSFALRKNQARVRYWVWLTASVKFLIPFSLLIALGGHLAKPRESTPAQAVVYSVVEDFSQPFAGQQMPVLYHQAPAAYHQAPTAAPVSLLHLLPAIVVAVWLVGIVVVLLRGLIGWVRISLMVRKAASVGGGLEVDALRRLESSLGVRKPIRLVLSPDWMEPGIFGIFRPVLIWPEGISRHLDDRHIEAILAHEVCHVRRHDNLTAVLHMLVEAVFWFHPLVWWMGARLEEERERACDEEVSLLYREPKIYAESILRVCKFCSESPLACVSGITGADLKKRIVQIMTERVVRKLDLGRKLLLLAVGLAVLAVPIVLAQAKAAQRMMLVALNAAPRQLQTMADAMMAQGQTASKADSAADVANAAVTGAALASVTIRPANTNAQGRVYGIQAEPSGLVRLFSMSLQSLVLIAYADLQKKELVNGGPKWTESDLFDISVQLDKADFADWDKLSFPQQIERVRPLVQTLLEQRFMLKEHAAMISTPVYALEQAKGGSKLKEVPKPTAAELEEDEKRREANKAADPPQLGLNVTPTGWTGHAVKIQELMGGLGYALSSWDKPMLDQTGLTGYYDLTLSLIKQEAGPTLEQQVEEQLGLRLDARNVPMTTFVIDSVEKPTMDAASATAPAPVAAPAPPPPPHIHFDVVSWKRCDPNAVKGSTRVDLPLDSDFVAYHCQPIYRIIYFAFSGPAPFALAGSAPFQLSGHPSWVDNDLYEFQAKVTPDDIAAWKAMTINDKRIAVRDILADQLKLHIHVDKTPQPAYALTVAKGGPKLTEYKAGEQWKLPDGRILQGRAQEYFGNIGYLQNSTMNNFAADLSVRLDRPVVDQTGLTGSYDISLPLTKATGADPFANIGDEGGSVESGLAQLGLKLVTTKTELDGLVVDHIERPPEN